MFCGLRVVWEGYQRCSQKYPPQLALPSHVSQDEPEITRLLFGKRRTSALQPKSHPSTQQLGDWTPIPANKKLSGPKILGLAIEMLTPISTQHIRYWVEL